MWFFVVVVFFFPEIEQQSSPVVEMGDTLEFSDIYQEVKGSWVSILLVLRLHVDRSYIYNRYLMHSYGR